jgi:transcription-repair coupling factor (superfamily II helicase)
MEIHDIAKLYAMLPQVGALRHVLENKSEKDVFLEGLVGSSQPLLFAALSQKEKKKPLPSSFLFVLPDADEAGYFYSDLMQLENLPKEGGESAGAAAQVLFFPSSYRRAVKYGQRDAANEILRTEVLARLNTSLSTLLSLHRHLPRGLGRAGGIAEDHRRSSHSADDRSDHRHCRVGTSATRVGIPRRRLRL